MTLSCSCWCCWLLLLLMLLIFIYILFYFMASFHAKEERKRSVNVWQLFFSLFSMNLFVRVNLGRFLKINFKLRPIVSIPPPFYLIECMFYDFLICLRKLLSFFFFFNHHLKEEKNPVSYIKVFFASRIFRLSFFDSQWWKLFAIIYSRFIAFVVAFLFPSLKVTYWEWEEKYGTHKELRGKFALQSINHLLLCP